MLLLIPLAMIPRHRFQQIVSWMEIFLQIASQLQKLTFSAILVEPGQPASTQRTHASRRQWMETSSSIGLVVGLFYNWIVMWCYFLPIFCLRDSPPPENFTVVRVGSPSLHLAFIHSVGRSLCIIMYWIAFLPIIIAISFAKLIVIVGTERFVGIEGGRDGEKLFAEGISFRETKCESERFEITNPSLLFEYRNWLGKPPRDVCLETALTIDKGRNRIVLTNLS